MQKQIQINKQSLIRLEKLKYCYDLLGQVMYHLEHYARMKGYKGQTLFNYYGDLNSNEITNESLYRQKLIAQLLNFEAEFKFYVEKYGKFEFPQNFSTKEIVTIIDNYINYIPKEDHYLYNNLKKIIHNQKTTIYEDANITSTKDD